MTHERYLDPQDDGLPLEDSGLWASDKLDYLRRYIDVFETSMRKNGQGGHILIFSPVPGSA